MARPPQLTTTSHAILGQLALRPWAAYELTKQMRRNVRFFWPRAESRIYDECKRLVDLGLAEAEQTRTGRRSRTTYSITDAGRKAVSEWLAEPPARGVELQSEAVLRVFLSSLGDDDALRRAIDRALEDVAEIFGVAGPIGHEYLEGQAPFQELVKHRALLFDFLASHAIAIADWGERARASVDAWEGLSDAEAEARALDTIRRGLAEVEARLGRPG